jgi:hypothetical protein
MFGGPMLGLFIAAIYVPVTNTKGGFIGFIFGAGLKNLQLEFCSIYSIEIG